MATEEIDFNLNDFDEQLTPCTFDSQFFDSDEIGENSQLTDSDKSSSISKKDNSTDQHLLSNSGIITTVPNQNGNLTNPDKKIIPSYDGNQFRQEIRRDFTPESWSKFTGLKARQFLEADLDAFKKPFFIGWKRELILRDSVLHPGKKIVEVFYFSPCGDVKLRSYVEMGMYFRTNQDTELEPENFTFAKQPIYTKPNETIVYVQALENGQSLLDKSSLPPPPSLTPLTPAISSSREVSKVESIDSDSALTHSNSDSEIKLPHLEPVSEGRAKRRRNAPTRFEDEDYSDQSLLKKKVRIPNSNQQPPPLTNTRNLNLSNKATSASSLPKLNSMLKDDKSESGGKKSPLPASDKSFTTDNTNGVYVNEEAEFEKTIELKIGSTSPEVKTTATEPEELEKNGQEKSRQSLSLLLPAGTRQSFSSVSGPNKINGQILTKKMAIAAPKMAYKQKIGGSKTMSMKLERKSSSPKTDIKNASTGKEEHFTIKQKSEVPTETTNQGCVSQNFVPPCSIMCGGRRALPSLLCSRCLCLFHPECVSKGIYLKKNNNFVCPNCIQSSDDGLPSTTFDRTKMNEESESVRHTTSSIDQPIQSRSHIPEVNFKSILKPSLNYKSKVSSVLTSSGAHLNPDGRKFAAPLHSSMKTPSLAAMLQFQNKNNLQSAKHSIHSTPQSTLRSVLVTGVKPIKNVIPNPQIFDRARDSHLKQPTASTALLHTLKSGTAILPSTLTNSEIQHNKSIANRRFHIENLNRSILSSQQLLQSLQKLTANSMASAPISLNSAFMRLRKPVRHRYRDYLNRKYAGFDSLLSGYNALGLIFEHLNTRDLMRFKLVSKSFYSLASQKTLWKTIRLKNIRIRDWVQFGVNISENSVSELCFDGIRPCSDESTDQMWQRASDLFPYLKFVRKLSFGRVPISFIVRLLDYAATKNAFTELIELSIRSLFDDAPQSGGCPLRFLQQLPVLLSLNSLRIASLGGITSDSCCLDRLNNIRTYVPKLINLYLPTFKGFSVQQFAFLEKLDQLEKLEIGSCESWITCEDEDLEGDVLATMVDLQMSPKSNFSGAFKYLSYLVNLRELKLIDVIVDEVSHQLSWTLQRMTNLQLLELDTVTVSPDATQTLNLLCNTIKTKLKNLKRFCISTNDSHTNKCVFELLLKRLDCVRELRWKVGSQVDDSGMCCVPFLRETEFSSDLDNEAHLDLTTNDETNTEMMEMCYLNDVLQKHLQHTRISILPQ